MQKLYRVTVFHISLQHPLHVFQMDFWASSVAAFQTHDVIEDKRVKGVWVSFLDLVGFVLWTTWRYSVITIIPSCVFQTVPAGVSVQSYTVVTLCVLKWTSWLWIQQKRNIRTFRLTEPVWVTNTFVSLTHTHTLDFSSVLRSEWNMHRPVTQQSEYWARDSSQWGSFLSGQVNAENNHKYS